MKIQNVQENKIFSSEEEFLKFVSLTGLTPHSSIAGVYNAIAKIANEEGTTIFTTTKSSEKERIQKAIEEKKNQTREEIIYSSWQALKDSLENKEELDQFDPLFVGNFLFVKLTGLTCDNYSKFSKIMDTCSLVIFKILDNSDKIRIDLEHKEIFCIDRQFGNDTTHTPRQKNGKCKTINRGENIKASVLQALEGVEIFEDNLFFAYKQKDVNIIEEIKENIFTNLSIEIDNIVKVQVEEEERIEEERRIERRKRIEEEENRAKNKEKQKEAQKKAKEEAIKQEKKQKAIEIFKMIYPEGDPTEEQIKDIMKKL